jgi:GNAT superfamily N-acetyltransferase
MALRAWQDMDLAIMVEGCFGVHIDPRTANNRERVRWLERLGDSYHPPTEKESEYARPYWLLRQGRPVGTVCLGCMSLGPGCVPVSSLYLLPEHRGAGVASKTLRAICAAVRAQGARGLRLETYWVWQDMVRYYLRQKFWLYMWKRELTLMWADDLPDYEVRIDDRTARFQIRQGDGWVDLYRARKDGSFLILEPGDIPAEGRPELRSPGEATFALALALAGWPLFQTADEQQAVWLSDGGRSGGLALRIESYEALARHLGWVVKTPRIPGIAYRSYEELFAPASSQSA